MTAGERFAFIEIKDGWEYIIWMNLNIEGENAINTLKNKVVYFVLLQKLYNSGLNRHNSQSLLWKKKNIPVVT